MDRKSGAGGSSSNRTQITVAVITTVGVIATGIFANWDKLFPPETAPRESRVNESDSSGDGDASAAVGVGEQTLAPSHDAVPPSRGQALLDRAVVEGVRVFESPVNTLLREQRAYADRFAAESTRYIAWELSLTHPEPPGELVTFPLDFRYIDGDGGVIAESTFEAYVEADWKTSGHASKWGRSSAGWWRPGLYRVEVRLADRPLGEKTFEVFAADEYPPATPEGLREAISLFELRFYETPVTLHPREVREYQTVFGRATTRLVGWELNLDYRRRPGSRIAFVIEAVYSTSAGDEVGRQRLDAAVEAGWTSSWHSRAWGWDEAGHWPPGTYRVELFLEGGLLTEGTFVIN